MSRAAGRNQQRKPTKDDVKQADAIRPGTPEAAQFGISDRVQGHPSPIPGGQKHLSNAPSVRHTVPVPPSDPEIYMGNAHGVAPGSHTNADRADLQRGPNTVHPPRPSPSTRVEKPLPIPVFLVEDHNRNTVRSAAPYHITVPGNTADPVRLCGRDPGRTAVLLLNESTAQNVRFAQTLRDLTNGGGALLPWPTNSYQKIETQDELYALSTSGTAATVSIIQVFEKDL
jgi:hypothetical protein